MDPSTLPYLDALFKEYLLFRGFTDSLQAFGAELKADKINGFQVDSICALLFRRILPSLQCTQLMELLQELDQHVYCRLDRSYEDAVGRMEVALVRYFVVTALKARRPEKVKELFELYGELLLSGKDGPAAWHPWFVLPYMTKPEADPRFQVFFTQQWAALVESSFRNFLAQAFQALPLPAVLRFDADRARRTELQRTVEALRRENADLRARLGLPPAGSDASSGGGKAGLAGSGGSAGAALAAELGGAGRPGAPSGAGPQPQASPYQSAYPSPAPLRRPAASQRGLGLRSRSSYDVEEPLAAQPSTASLASQQQQQPEAWGTAEGAAAAPAALAARGSGSSLLHAGSRGEWYSEAEAEPRGQEAGAAQGQAQGQGQAPPLEGARELSEYGLAREGAPSDEPAGLAAAARPVLRPRERLSGGHEAPITCCVFGPQGSNVASASADGVVKIWAPASLVGAGAAAAAGAARAGSFSCGGVVTSLAWDWRGDKLMLAGTRGRGIKAWHLDTQRLVFQVDPEGDAPTVTHLACSPADATFACATSDAALSSGRLALWNLRAFKKAHAFALPAAAAVTCCAWSPDGHQLAAAGIDGKMRLFDPASRNQVMAWPVADPGIPFVAAFLGSSRLLATLSADGYIKLWSAAVVRGPLAGLHVPLCAVGPGSGGRPASAGALQQAWRLPRLAANPAGTVLAASSSSGEVPVVFVGAGGEELRLEAGLPGQSGAVTALDWHPGGAVLVSGSADRSLILSDLVPPRSPV